MFTISSLKQGIATFFPGYFALVMATGIVAIAANFLGMPWIAFPLHYLNITAYGVLWIITIIRLLAFFPNVVQDMKDHLRGPGFFTIVAGTCVVGKEMILIDEHISIAMMLWVVGIVLWCIVMFSFFTSVFLRENKPVVESGINGAWLLAVVATQSVSILGSLLSPQFGEGREAVLFSSLSMYVLGCMLYVIIITLIFYRLSFTNVTAKALTPPYWITMGAAAITTLSGATLILKSSQWQFLQDILPFLKGFTILFWAVSTWWIPLLIIAGVWRHFYKRFPFEYDPQYWGMVFPLGMYTVCTLRFSQSAGVSFLHIIPQYFIYLALVAWIVVFGGMMFSVVGTKKTG